LTTSNRKKHSCPDCRECQHCAETRCRVCQGQAKPEKCFAHLSFAEQIALYEALNRGAEKIPKTHV